MGGKLLEEKSLDLSVRNATNFGMEFFRDCIKDVNINKYFLQMFARFQKFQFFCFQQTNSHSAFLTLFVMRNDYPKVGLITFLSVANQISYIQC